MHGHRWLLLLAQSINTNASASTPQQSWAAGQGIPCSEATACLAELVVGTTGYIHTHDRNDRNGRKRRALECVFDRSDVRIRRDLALEP